MDFEWSNRAIWPRPLNTLGVELIKGKNFKYIAGLSRLKTTRFTLIIPRPILGGRPFYRKLEAIGLYIISALAGFLSLVIMYQFSRYYVNESIALLSSIILGLGTPIFFYSLVYWEHTSAFVISIMILLLTMRIIKGEKKTLLFIPPLMFLCLWVRSETAPFIIAILMTGVIVMEKNCYIQKRITDRVGGCYNRKWGFRWIQRNHDGGLFGKSYIKTSVYVTRNLFDFIAKVSNVLSLSFYEEDEWLPE